LYHGVAGASDNTQGEMPTDEPGGAAVEDATRDALSAAFTRLQPQGSDAWNFLAAFTHLGDRYGPYQPGASDLSRARAVTRTLAPSRSWQHRLRARFAGRPRPGTGVGVEPVESEIEAAMVQVVEAFRFLSARVRTLEARLAFQDDPVAGAAWLVPATDLGPWVDVVAEHVRTRLSAAGADGEVVHADCGDGALVVALQRAGVRVRGVEPRGAVALGALENGLPITLCEIAEDLAGRPDASLGGLVLHGVVDRLPVHALVALIGAARRTLALGAPLVVVTSDPATVARWAAPAADLLGARPLHYETWELLFQRAGFDEVAALSGPEGDGRVAITAVVPA
jgi:hypothetical protein